MIPDPITPVSSLSHVAREPGIVHATTVCVGQNGLLIVGPPGSGKTTLAWKMLGCGARLVADDRTELSPGQHPAGQVIASPPATIAGQIEARGLGVIRVPHCSGVRIRAVLDLAQTETDRIPEVRSTVLCGHRVRLLYRVAHDHFPMALVHFLRADET